MSSYYFKPGIAFLEFDFCLCILCPVSVHVHYIAEKNLKCIIRKSRQGVNDNISSVFLGRPVTSWSSPSLFHHGWRKFLNLVPPDALKIHSLAVPVLRFLCKTFSKLRKLNNETLFSVDV